MSEINYVQKIAATLGLNERQVEKTVQLIEQGCTIPFIARYRKEATGALNEVQIAAIRDQLLRLKELDKRRATITQSISEQGKMTPELAQRLQTVDNMTELEDLYLPYRPHRKTRASVAIAKGLEPLATALRRQTADDLERLAAPYVNEALGVNNIEEALAGARDIIAEQVSENAVARSNIRHLYKQTAQLRSKVVKGKEDEGGKYKSWFDWTEDALKAPSHRVLAMLRGEEEGWLRLKVAPADDTRALQVLDRLFVRGYGAASQQVEQAVHDGYRRLMAPAMETELRNVIKERADADAIKIFAENLRQLLLAPPLGQKRTLAIDPGFRTGCKVVCLDAQGQLLHNITIYPFTSMREQRLAISQLENLVEAFQIDAIAIGNGTAGRETEAVVKKCHFNRKVVAVSVSENGASVYSASDVAREEFPDYDITVRGAVSIGRRLMDPLSELVKIDPKSIGVGQYQHDVNQTALQDSLNDVVVSCVNSVGVELNTASKELLSYVSGIGPALARRIVDYRNRNGAFHSRHELLQVERMGDRSFEQCAGFLRVRESDNPLDHSAVHPERYALVERMARQMGTTVEGLMKDKALRQQININDFVTDDCGIPTLQDIMQELDKPGIDPRCHFEIFEFDPNVTSIEDLKEGMVLPGIVTNITAFGAFVDIGVHQDGLVHISQLARRRPADPNEVVHLHQHVHVKVIEVDLKRNRISLSMKDV